MDVIGLPIDDYVSKQINIRQKKLATTQGNIDTNTLLFTNSNKPWLRAASSVDMKSTYLKELGLDEAKYGGNLLAKQVVLQNSVSDYSNIQSPVQLGGYSAYEFFYDPNYGPKPPPGIESFSASHINNGSIRQGTLKIKCFTPKQFDIILALYARIGFTMLIEWGHSAYFKNDGDFPSPAVVGASGVLDSFLQGTKSFEGLLKEIRSERIKSDGNYNGFLGRVVNFTFSNTAGVYDIDIKLITQGAIIESLVISNTYTVKTEEASGNDDTKSSAAQRSVLSRALLNLTQKTFTSLGGNYHIDTLETKNIPDSYFSSNPVVDHLVIQVKTNTTDKNYYIKFGYLLYLIEKYCLVYNKSNEPVVRIYKAGGFLGSTAVLMETMPLMTSGDLDVCFLAPNPDKGVGITVDAESIEVGKGFRRSEIYLGNLYHLHINIDFVNSILDRSMDSKGNLTLFKLLNDLVQGVQIALGNVNNLVVTYDEELNRIDVIDKSRYTARRTKESRMPIYLGGVLTGSFGSFVKKAELQSEVPNSLQQLAAIGATNNFSNKGDVTLFSLMNSGSEDRIIGKLKEKNVPEELKEDTNVNVDLWAGYVGEAYTTFRFSDDFKIPFKRLNIDVQTAIKQSLTLSTAKNPSKFIPFNLKLDLQGLSGFKLLQEIEINDGGANIVPFYLKKNFSFILKEVNDQVTDAGWTTSLGTFVVSVDRNTSGVYGTNTYTRAFKAVTENTSATPTKLTATVFQNNIKRFICSFFYDPNYQWQDFQLAGVMGVIMFESNFNSSIKNQSGGSAFGICQWLGARLDSVETQKIKYKNSTPNPVNLKDFTALLQPRRNAFPPEDAGQPGFLIAPSDATKALPNDFDVQLLFIKKELETNYKRVAQKIKAATDLSQVVRIWLEDYEGIPQYITDKKTGQKKLNPHWNQAYLPQRTAFANDFLKRMALDYGADTLAPTSTNITQFKGKSPYGAY